jgi:(E)-4-hydroxy-3-methylbut-2-enyl-diphosphate synthase
VEKNRDIQFHTMIKLAIEHDKPVRIRVNWSSMDQQILAQLLDQNARAEQPIDLTEINRMAMLIQSALSSAQMAQDIGLAADKIIISCKISHVNDLMAMYKALVKKSSYALHLGVTEAGMGDKGAIASTSALAILLNDDIGDTIRISLTPERGSSRTREVKVAQKILQSLNKRSFSPTVIACPDCGRTGSDYFQVLAQQIQKKCMTQ